MLMPAAVGFFYGENRVAIGYLAMAVLVLLLGFLLSRKKPKNQTFYAKEAFVSVPLCWIFMSILGCIPFILSGEIPRFVDALFEMVSGFSTTGCSILPSLQGISHATIFWRSLSHWIGGMGMLVFILSVLPIANGATMHLMRVESTGPQVEKAVPKIKDASTILYIIYTAMTVLEMIILIIGNVPVFESITLSLGTAGTGGFSVSDAGITQPFAQYVIAIFMILFGVNFNVYVLIIRKHLKQALRVEEARWYLLIIAISVACITLNTLHLFPTVEEAIRSALFQVGSIITTTGYATYDFAAYYPMFSQMIIFILMFIGACAGSTGGGMKVSRVTIMAKTVRGELLRIIHPRAVKKVHAEGKPVDDITIRSINIYFIGFFGVFITSMLLVALFDNKDFTTTLTSVTSTINNIGPGLGEVVGPTGNFSSFSDGSKLVFCFNMLAGRLEILPFLVLINPRTWNHPFRTTLSNKK